MRARHQLLGAVVTQFVRPRSLVGWLAGRWRCVRLTDSGTGGWLLCLTCNLKTTSSKSASALDSRSASWHAEQPRVSCSESTIRRSWFARRPSVTGLLSSRVESSGDSDPLWMSVISARCSTRHWLSTTSGYGTGARLTDLRGALRPGGRVAIVSQPRCLGASAETTERVCQETAGRLHHAGFISNQRETLKLRPPVACVLAEAPRSERVSCLGGHDSVQ
jgi:hypothetical protein